MAMQPRRCTSNMPLNPADSRRRLVHDITLLSLIVTRPHRLEFLPHHLHLNFSRVFLVLQARIHTSRSPASVALSRRQRGTLAWAGAWWHYGWRCWHGATQQIIIASTLWDLRCFYPRSTLPVLVSTPISCTTHYLMLRHRLPGSKNMNSTYLGWATWLICSNADTCSCTWDPWPVCDLWAEEPTAAAFSLER